MKGILIGVLFLTTGAFAATQLDDLIRGEMAAVKTYENVIKDNKNQDEVKKLTTIKQNHQNAVTKLKTYANTEVKEETKGSGAWGSFTKAYTSGAKLFGNETALKALQQGEEHGIKEYKEALNDDSISNDLKTLIKTQFLPKQEEHIKTLRTFM